MRVRGGRYSQMIAQMTIPETQANAWSMGRRVGDCAKMTMARQRVMERAMQRGINTNPISNLVQRHFMEPETYGNPFAKAISSEDGTIWIGKIFLSDSLSRSAWMGLLNFSIATTISEVFNIKISCGSTFCGVSS